jgi:hypothetical protein
LDKHLHIVTHDVPWPVDFGGVFDLFYKIRALHELGIKIHLHCFTKLRTEQNMLNRYCVTVEYYPRKTSISSFSLKIPYLVKSRNHKALLENLKKDNYPILLEGIHCTYLLYKGLLKERKVMLRLHNVEYLYYQQLAIHEQNFFKKIYFHFESRLLKKYEHSVAQMADIISLSKKDVSIYNDILKARNISFLPAFVPWFDVKSPTNLGSFCLYQGNLEINENEKAALWLLENVFKDLKIPFVIAGKNPSVFLQKKAHEFEHTCIVSNPSDFEMQDMINKAQINILPSFNKTGIKLKILNALFNGRHCITNINAIEASDLVKLCHTSNDAQEMKITIELMFKKPFTETDIEQRRALLLNKFNNKKNAERLIEWIW